MVDTLGLLMVVAVTAGHVDDAAAAPTVLESLDREAYPRLKVVWADGKYHNHTLNGWKDGHPELGWELVIVRRPDGVKGFTLLPKRWVVERTFGWLGRARRLSRNYERLNSSSESMIRVRSIQLILNRMDPQERYPRLNIELHQNSLPGQALSLNPTGPITGHSWSTSHSAKSIIPYSEGPGWFSHLRISACHSGLS
ncbi:Mobile element protein [Fimbriiglobus ruber]|uniref:Mobile element protein n=1 Tax=Fimbriiglobus ruber TaxID=1908690 RepID=A0A225DJE5_9BACT|nr:Mobile element protein [Fimbriiglobus ruber]